MAANAVWHEDDVFWRGVMTTIFSQERWSKTAEEITQLIELLKPEPGCRVLDMCCGPGRHSLELARRGFRVTGVDRTEHYLEEARRRAAEESLDVEFIHSDARQFSRPESFDLALNLYTSFGYFDDPADQMRMLANLFAALKPDGKFVLDTMSKEVLARRFQERSWEEHEGMILLEERRLFNDWAQIECRWIVLEGQTRHEHVFRHWLYSAAEIKEIFRQTGFRDVAVFGNLNGEPYDQNATRLIAMAQK